MSFNKALFGEFLGTFIIVFIGCSTIAIGLLYSVFVSLLSVALIWGIGVAIAIYVTRSFSAAHLNPAVSLSSYLLKEITFKKFILNSLMQLAGAFFAAVILFLLFNSDITSYELLNGITRGSEGSHQSAIMFGEFYPNPGAKEITELSDYQAMLFEGAGTLLLVFVILMLNFIPTKYAFINPLIIGATVTLIICLIAPYTQAGINPARDFGPRLMAYFGGWQSAAFPIEKTGFFTVYILAPFLGAILATYFYKYSLKK